MSVKLAMARSLIQNRCVRHSERRKQATLIRGQQVHSDIHLRRYRVIQRWSKHYTVITECRSENGMLSDPIWRCSRIWSPHSRLCSYLNCKDLPTPLLEFQFPQLVFVDSGRSALEINIVLVQHLCFFTAVDLDAGNELALP